MTRLTDNLETIADRIRGNFSARDAAREQVLPLCREVIRHCSQAIRAVHRHEFDRATEGLHTARQLLDQAQQAGSGFEELGHANFFKDAQKEYAEGRATLALVTGQPLPSPDELKVDDAAYLNGLGEAVGELRRYLLDSLRQGDTSHGEELLAAMDDIYSILVTMDFPDAITGGLRRTTDMVRGVLERTRSDLTLIIREGNLEAKLERFEEKLP
ncbi:MAG: haloacid dehalogenase [Chloroflexota bacterium]